MTGIAGRLPPVRFMKQTIRKARHVDGAPLANPDNLDVFVPTSDIVAAFDELIKSTFFRGNKEMLQQLVNYFEDNWIGRLARRGGRSTP